MLIDMFCVCIKVVVSHNSISSIRMGYLLVVLAVVLVPVLAQNNHSLSCPGAVGQVSRRVDQLVDLVNGGLNDRLNQLPNQFNQLSNQLNQLSNQLSLSFYFD